MLILVVILLLCTEFVDKSNSISLTLISKQRGENSTNGVESSCIAEDNERYSGIGWIYPFPENAKDIPNITTKFLPSLTSNYNCKFTENAICIKQWTIKNWQVSDQIPGIDDNIVDSRWDELPTFFTSNKTKTFKERVEITNEFQLAFSVRSVGGFVKLFICDGWDPYHYPCYQIKINKSTVDLQQKDGVPDEDFPSLSDYRVFTNVLPPDEWRTFEISLKNGTLLMQDINFENDIIRYKETEPLKPLYFFIQSEMPTLWKIHKNYFMYTTSAQMSRLGPSYTITSKDLCISLYVKMCSDCKMRFFYLNNTESVSLKEIEWTTKWTNIKLKEQNIQIDKINIFVETSLKTNQGNHTDAFWAIDNVRVCNENEVRITYLNLNSNDDSNIVSCQLINKPNWRPKLLQFSENRAFPNIEVTPNVTSIKISWPQEDEGNRINYFISYQASDICSSPPHNLRRLKSTGFIVTKTPEVVLENLPPYTHYDINISSVLHEDKIWSVSTLQPGTLTIDEIPNKVQIRASDRVVYISWERLDCRQVYGYLYYDVIVRDFSGSVIKKLEYETNNFYKIDALKPFTNYNLELLAYRNTANRNKSKPLFFNFTTLSGVGAPPTNVDLYSINEETASFRFDIQKDNPGIAEYVQGVKCNLLSYHKCKTYTNKLTKCPLWPQKYCFDIPFLIKGQTFTFKLSIKNTNSDVFGDSFSMIEMAVDRVPGPPLNISYIVDNCNNRDDFCHLNITWLHPYFQNATITSFTLFLNATMNDEVETIHEIHPIINNTYMHKYTHQIKFIPFSTKFNVYIRSDNKHYHSEYVWKEVQTDDIGDYLNQSPELVNKTSDSVTFKLRTLDPRLTSYSALFIVQDFNKEKSQLSDELLPFRDDLCNQYGDGWIGANVTVDKVNVTRNITIDKLRSNERYCFTFVIENLHHGKTHQIVYYEEVTDLGTHLSEEEKNAQESVEPSSSSNKYAYLWVLLVILLLVPIGYFGYIYFKRRHHRTIPKSSNEIENEYETLPFEECDNFVNNATYDHLSHK